MIKYNKTKNLLGKISFRVMTVIALIAIFMLGSALSKEVYREYKIKKEIDGLKSQIESMKKDNYELSQLIEYYQTDQYKEEEARKRLNLKGDGEKVVMINNNAGNAQQVETKTDQQKVELPNYMKWWNYFFATRG